MSITRDAGDYMRSMASKEKLAANMLDGSVAGGFAGSSLTVILGLFNMILFGATDRSCGASVDPCLTIAYALTYGIIIIGILQFWATYQVLRKSSRGATVNVALGLVLIFMSYAIYSIMTKNPISNPLPNQEPVALIKGYEFLVSVYYLLSPIAVVSGLLAWYSFHIAPPVKRISGLAEAR